MPIEIEVRGLLTVEEFVSLKSKFTQNYGLPRKEKRFAIRIGNYRDLGINTRIRITNGKSELVQKIDQGNSTARSEVIIAISNDANYIYDLYRSLFNMVSEDKRKNSVIMQFENYLFDIEAFELKLTHQSGKIDRYLFELELKDNDLDINELVAELGLDPNMQEMTHADWERWNDELNLNASQMSEEEIKVLMQDYLQVD